MPSRSRRASAAAVYKALRKKFGARSAYAKKDPLDHVMFNILLSGASLDKAERAFSAIKSSYVDWNEVRVTSVRELSSLLESKRCAPKKAEFIKAFLQRLYLDNHSLSVQPIQKMSTKRAREYVGETTGLPPEQVATILLEIFDMPVSPIPNVVKWTLIRLGLIKSNATPTQAQEAFLSVASKGKTATAYRVLHILARDYCRQEGQLCLICPVKKHCPTGRNRVKERRAADAKEAAAKKTAARAKK